MRIAALAIAAMATYLAQPAYSATVFKCVDSKGKVTFTQANCPDEHALDDVVTAHNPSPSGSSAPVQMAPSRRQQFTSSPEAARDTSQRGVKVVSQSPCSTGLSSTAQRTATVRGEAKKGMTQKEIESIYGKPDNVSSTDGKQHYRYYNSAKKEYVSIGFDKNGCANYLYQSKDK
ncbi:DUF4124 domain-containing protein [Metapseudomonas sp. CR1201]